MKKKIIIFVILVFLFFFFSFQIKKENKTVNVFIRPFFERKELVLNHKQYITNLKDTVIISTFKFYISNIVFEYENGTIYKEQNSFHLIDFENIKTEQFQFNNCPNLKIKKIVFNVGIDSLTSVSENFNTDLDPSLGMYWAWNSGYINMKLEGKSSSCTSIKKEFQFHIGGYLRNQNALQKIVLATDGLNDLIIKADVSAWLNKISLKEINAVVLPGKKAIDMSSIYKSMFTLDEQK